MIGLFEEWNCTTREIDLRPRDTLVMFTDGVVEAFNAEGEEFGEGRLIDCCASTHRSRRRRLSRPLSPRFNVTAARHSPTILRCSGPRPVT